MAREYTPSEYTKAWIRAFMGALISIIIAIYFHSIFLAFLAAAFFIFIPLWEEETERGINALFFTCLMLAILFLAFRNSQLWGLGLDIKEYIEWGYGLGRGLAIGFAFFAFLKALTIMATPRGGMWASAELQIVLNLLMILCGLGALFVLQIWKWPPSAIIFVGIWAIAFLTGSTGDVVGRQQIGAFLLVVSFFIYSVGIGTQMVGTALFGEWWPTVYQTGQSIIQPISQLWSQLTGTFGMGWQLLTNPVGFAQQMMNGTYAADPLTGLRGAFGVEIIDFRTTPIYPYQTFQVIAQLKNQGAFKAENVNFLLDLGEEAPPGLKIGDMFPSEDGNGKPKQSLNSMARLDVRQVMFTGKITCEQINKARAKTKITKKLEIRRGGLREFIIPIKGTVSYDYKIESTLDIEFLSKSEWDRLVREGQLITQQKKPATLTNAPVRLNIDTLEQPIKEGTQFYIGLALQPATDGNISKVSQVFLEIPAEFPDPKCSTACKLINLRQDSKIVKKILLWDNEDQVSDNDWPPTNTVYCLFDGLLAEQIEPSRTFTIKANATYRFEKSKTYPAKIEFGGGCCGDEDCPEGYTCVPKTDQPGVCIKGEKKELEKIEDAFLPPSSISNIPIFYSDIPEEKRVDKDQVNTYIENYVPELELYNEKLWEESVRNNIDPSFTVAAAARTIDKEDGIPPDNDLFDTGYSYETPEKAIEEFTKDEWNAVYLYKEEEIRPYRERILRMEIPPKSELKETTQPSEEQPPAEGITVLMYHHILPEEKIQGLAKKEYYHSQELFEQEIEWLKDNGYKSITPKELVRFMKGEITLPEKSILITFDDGYQDFFDYAWPILQKYGFKATLFIITSVPAPPGVKNPQTLDFMTWGTLKTLKNSGLITLGCHMNKHIVPYKQSFAEVELNLKKCIQRFKDELGMTPEFLAWPGGHPCEPPGKCENPPSDWKTKKESITNPKFDRTVIVKNFPEIKGVFTCRESKNKQGGDVFYIKRAEVPYLPLDCGLEMFQDIVETGDGWNKYVRPYTMSQPLTCPA